MIKILSVLSALSFFAISNVNAALTPEWIINHDAALSMALKGVELRFTTKCRDLKASDVKITTTSISTNYSGVVSCYLDVPAGTPTTGFLVEVSFKGTITKNRFEIESLSYNYIQ